MAIDKIDQLEIGSTKYDIDLPPDATPSIAGLTVSGAISEGGTSLVNKYLGKSAKSADSDKLDGNDSAYYLNYNNLTGTPIPGDSGEIKTKYRCALKGYTGSGNQIWYYKLVKLPADNSGNYASAIINGRIGGWTASGMSAIYCLIWNRDGVGLALLDIGGTGTMSSIFDTVDLVVYKNSDNTADIYIRCKDFFTFDLDVEVYQSTASITYDGTYITTTPSGTESGKASTSTSRLQLEKGVLKINGTAVTTSSKSAAEDGTDLSLVTTGEKYTWNNKQDKISTTGTTTVPVYFSSNGVVHTCASYAGGTNVTLNGVSKGASTASFYAPTSIGTNGQMLISNGTSPVWADKGTQANYSYNSSTGTLTITTL